MVRIAPQGSRKSRYFHVLERGKVVRFSVQYESLIGGEWRAIVRYDTAHGRPHKDLLHPNGAQERQDFRGYSPAEVLVLGERDIKANWQQYRSVYEQVMMR